MTDILKVQLEQKVDLAIVEVNTQKYGTLNVKQVGFMGEALAVGGVLTVAIDYADQGMGW